MANVVLVVDMLRGFFEDGYPLYCGEGARKIIPNVQRLLERETAQGAKIIYLCDNHAPDDLEFQMFPPHCIKGTPEADIIPELRAFPGAVIHKTRYSGFYGTSLEEGLKAAAPEKIIVCGVCTDICVMHTVADARNRDYPVEVPGECVASFDEEAHRYALQHMEKILGAKVVRSSGSESPVSF